MRNQYDVTNTYFYFSQVTVSLQVSIACTQYRDSFAGCQASVNAEVHDDPWRSRHSDREEGFESC